MTPAFSQSAWDADKDAPPPTREATPMPQPTKIKPFSFLFYQLCEANNDTVQYIGKWSFDILSEYGSVGFDHHENDSLVVLKLRTQNRGEREAKIWFPKKPFTLLVILGRDTAVFKMDLILGSCLYVDTSALLTVIQPREIPANFCTMQFLDREEKRAKDFLKAITKEFGSVVEPGILESGYYPCIPAFAVERAKLGRKQSVNQTALGYLVCLRVTDSSQVPAVSQWIWEQQREEFKRAGSMLGMKER